MNDLTKLAHDLTAAGLAISGEAGQIVRSEAGQLEGQIRQLDGTSTQVTVTYPSETSARLQGQETFGVTQEVSPLSGIDSLDVRSVADDMASSLAAAGAKLITGR